MRRDVVASPAAHGGRGGSSGMMVALLTSGIVAVEGARSTVGRQQARIKHEDHPRAVVRHLPPLLKIHKPREKQDKSNRKSRSPKDVFDFFASATPFPSSLQGESRLLQRIGGIRPLRESTPSRVTMATRSYDVTPSTVHEAGCGRGHNRVNNRDSDRRKRWSRRSYRHSISVPATANGYFVATLSFPRRQDQRESRYLQSTNRCCM